MNLSLTHDEVDDMVCSFKRGLIGQFLWRHTNLYGSVIMYFCAYSARIIPAVWARYEACRERYIGFSSDNLEALTGDSQPIHLTNSWCAEPVFSRVLKVFRFDKTISMCCLLAEATVHHIVGQSS